MAKNKLKPGFGSITKLGGKRRKPYRVTVLDGYDENGKQKRKSIGYYATYEEALDALVQHNRTPVNLDYKDITIYDAFEFWSKVHFHKIGEHSIKKYQVTFRKHLQPIHSVKLRELKVDHILMVMENKTLPIQYDIRCLMRMISLWAMQRDIIYKDYAAGINLGDAKYSQAKKRTNRVFTKEEIKRLWEDVHIEGNDIVLILLYTGMRISEILRLENKDIHLDENYMMGGVKKYDKERKLIKRMIPIHPEIKPLIEARMNKKNKYLITTMNGKQMTYDNYIKTYWNEDHHRHDTRHTFLTRMQECGADYFWTKRIVGHSIAGASEIYLHIKPEIIYKEICKLNYVK